ncbi:kinetochore protein Spc25 isoform X2 [Gadus morhua]|uniref:kinetochore protein Spc25 isoform X2 n=1 Tax=Gadus morhua TaxID=8049 RepID=UPI0011B6CDAA|nr:kinetochore protein Spc25 isoform X2 [Gadus morhua]
MTMASIKDPHVVDSFRVAMEEVYSRLLVQTSGEISEAAVELGLSHRRSMKSAADTCSKKCEDDKLFETIQTNKQDLAKKTLLMKEKRDAISRSLVEMEQKQGQKDALRLQMETLREEQAERRGCESLASRGIHWSSEAKSCSLFSRMLTLQVLKTYIPSPWGLMQTAPIRSCLATQCWSPWGIWTSGSNRPITSPPSWPTSGRSLLPRHASRPAPRPASRLRDRKKTSWF